MSHDEWALLVSCQWFSWDELIRVLSHIKLLLQLIPQRTTAKFYFTIDWTQQHHLPCRLYSRSWHRCIADKRQDVNFSSRLWLLSMTISCTELHFLSPTLHRTRRISIYLGRTWKSELLPHRERRWFYMSIQNVLKKITENLFHILKSFHFIRFVKRSSFRWRFSNCYDHTWRTGSFNLFEQKRTAL